MSAFAGDEYTFNWVFTQTGFNRFADLSGDDNPIHVDPEFASRTKFGRTVAHGMFLFGIICQGLNMHFPDRYLLRQELVFPNPTYVGERLVVKQTLLPMTDEADQIEIRSLIVKPGGELGCEAHSSLLEITKLERVSPGSLVMADIPPSPVSTYKGLEIGQRASTERIFSKGQVAEYIDLTGDTSRFYLDSDFARSLGISSLLVPPPLLGGMISYLLGTRTPGCGTNWLKQSFLFHRPVFWDDPVTAEVEVSRLRPDKELVDLTIKCTTGDGDLACSGRSLVLVKDLQT